MVSDILPLTLNEVEVRRAGQRIIGPLSLKIAAGGVTMVLGPNGSGKTTFLRLMHGLERARGRMDWAVDQANAQAAQAFVFQTPVMMRRTVLDCIAYPLLLRGEGRTAARKAAEDAAEGAGLGHALNLRAPQISGGEKQKLALARALITQPQVLFLDEPCSSLDGRATREIEEALLKASAEGVKIVMSTHNLGQAQRLADEALFMAKGQVIEQRPAADFFTAPETAEAQAFLDGRIVE